MDNDEFLRYFVKDQQNKWDKVDEQFALIHTKLDSLHEFRVQTKTSTWWISGIFGAVMSIVVVVIDRFLGIFHK